MKFFLDTEFVEGTQKGSGFFRKATPPTIDLISIGIVGEDGSEYYAVSNEFNLNEAWNRFDLKLDSGDMRNKYPNGRKHYWLRENVLYKIFAEMYRQEYPAEWNFTYGNIENFMGDMERKGTGYSIFLKLLGKYGKSRKEIAKDVLDFCGNRNYNNDEYFTRTSNKGMSFTDSSPEFYAYYCAYDWVVFCWLFGRMIDLPKGWPMFCNDLKPMFDQMVLKIKEDSNNPNFNAKTHALYPKNENEHHALSDAKFDRDLYNFIDLF